MSKPNTADPERQKEIEELEQAYDTDHNIGEQNITTEIRFHVDFHNPVFIASSILILAFLIATLLFTDSAQTVLGDTRQWITSNFDWFFISAGNVFVLFCLLMIVLPLGSIRVGGQAAKPEFSRLSWFAMLFAAGMGIGLMFYGVAEPIGHFDTALQGTSIEADTRAGEDIPADAQRSDSAPLGGAYADEEAAARLGMAATIFHWGLHPWATFIIVALSLAYFAYRKGLPLTLRSILYPFIGNRIYGPIGDTVDILTVGITAFGVSQSLGLGVIQMNSGLNHVFGLPVDITIQLGMIALIMLLAVASALSGVGRGIRLLSEWNMLLSVVIVVVILAIGPTRYILNTLLQSTGDYVNNIVSMSLWSDATADTGWQNYWTAFYWPWWMTWAPFVGMFIARISRGRTIREMIGGGAERWPGRRPETPRSRSDSRAGFRPWGEGRPEVTGSPGGRAKRRSDVLFRPPGLRS